MAFTMQHLLRLPPTLRCQVLKNASFLSGSFETRQSQARLFLRRTYAQAKPPSRPRRTSAPTSPSQGINSPPTPAFGRRTPNPTGNPYADRLFNGADQVLLYNSPRHTSYIITSFLAGALFFLGGINTALETKERPPVPKSDGSPALAQSFQMPWYIRYSFALGAIGFATLGTVFVLAPTKLIRRVWLLKPQPQQGTSGTAMGHAFKLEIKSTLPFREGRTITTALPNVSIDREIRAQDIYWHNIPLSSTEAFTAHYLPSTHPVYTRPDPVSPSITARLRSVNGSLMNAWPTFRANIKRMFLREGIAYVHIIGEDGQWKLDLQGAEVLDGGLPLESLMGTDVNMAKGVLPFVQRLSARGRGSM